MLRKLQRELGERGLRGVFCVNRASIAPLPLECLHTTRFVSTTRTGENGVDTSFAATAAVGKGSLIAELAASAAGDAERLTLIRLAELACAYRRHGHCLSTVDPLDLPREPPFHRFIPKDVDLILSHSTYGLTDADLSMPLKQGLVAGHMGSSSTVGECIENLKKSYCGDFAAEFAGLPTNEQSFFVDRIERPAAMEPTREERLTYFQSLANAVLFEKFCIKAFPTVKRFGADGIESMVVSLDVISRLAQQGDVDSLMMAMSHRGRLNVLVNILQRPLAEMFAEFRGKNWYAKEGSSEFSGDVKYHFGYRSTRGNLKLEMLHNPSHLQFVHPVAVGHSRARQMSLGLEPSKVVPVVLHGDAAFSGEGVTYEAVQMSRIPEYSVGGTINIVVNNQIGFTTYPSVSASTVRTTDLAKMVGSPALHVNAHNVEAVVFASRIAFEYRQTFGKDVFINLIGFRKFGHNELDMPKFTNAEMYARIDKMEDVLTTYRKFLISNSIFTESELADVEARTQAMFEKELKSSIELVDPPPPPQYLDWKPCDGTSSNPVTGVEQQKLKEIGTLLNAIPDDFQLHPAIRRVFKERVKAIETGTNIDTGMAEALAYGSLAQEGFHIRLAGQDSKRGTFSHRHSTVQCQKSFKTFNIFSGLEKGNNVEILNSLLSETAAMAFEYGYGLESPQILNIWEAQFGDFANVAQSIIDEFVMSGETKWGQSSAMCLYLPHGSDGQGPDHSSARLERYLQLSDEVEDVSTRLSISREEHAKKVNVAIINCTKSSNLFHALRRQMLRDFHKPLILMTGKKLLKLRGTYCDLAEFGPEKSFRAVLPDFNAKVDAVDTLILCSGQVYFDLVNRAQELGRQNISVVPVEQLCPFPVQELKAEFERFPYLKRLVWCQEEHANAGAWTYMSPRVTHLLRHIGSSLQIEYAGRPPLAAPSCGDGKTHGIQLQILLRQAIPDQ